MEDAERFTILFPTRIVVNILLGFSSISDRIFAFLFPSSFNILTRTLLIVVMAVSADEKNADNKSKQQRVTNNIMFMGSIKFSFIYKYLYKILHNKKI